MNAKQHGLSSQIRHLTFGKIPKRSSPGTHFQCDMQSNSSLWIDVILSFCASDVKILVNLGVEVLEFAFQTGHTIFSF